MSLVAYRVSLSRIRGGKENIHLFIDKIHSQILQRLEIQCSQGNALCVTDVAELEQEGNFWLRLHGGGNFLNIRNGRSRRCQSQWPLNCYPAKEWKYVSDDDDEDFLR